MEVNARPELKDDVIDKVVNRPIVRVSKIIFGRFSSHTTNLITSF